LIAWFAFPQLLCTQPNILQIEVIECNKESCYGNTWEAPNLKMLTVGLLCQNKTSLSNLKNAKNLTTWKATQTWLNVWQTRATERKLNQQLEEYQRERFFLPCHN